MNLIKKDRYFINKERVLMWHFSNDVLIATKCPDNKWDASSMEWTIDEMKDCGRSECDSQGNPLDDWRYFQYDFHAENVYRANSDCAMFKRNGDADWTNCTKNNNLPGFLNLEGMNEITEASAMQKLGLAESPKPETVNSSGEGKNKITVSVYESGAVQVNKGRLPAEYVPLSVGDKIEPSTTYTDNCMKLRDHAPPGPSLAQLNFDSTPDRVYMCLPSGEWGWSDPDDSDLEGPDIEGPDR